MTTGQGPGKPNPRQELDGILDRQGVGSGYRGQLIGNLEDYVRDISLAGQAEELTSLEARLKTAQECALALDQSREELFSRVRDAEDARKAAVGLLEKQNLELVRLKAAQARVRAVRDQWSRYTQAHQTMRLFADLDTALDA